MRTHEEPALDKPGSPSAASLTPRLPHSNSHAAEKQDTHEVTHAAETESLFTTSSSEPAMHGEAFGLSPFFRISYATSMDNIKLACDRIGELCDEATS